MVIKTSRQEASADADSFIIRRFSHLTVAIVVVVVVVIVAIQRVLPSAIHPSALAKSTVYRILR